MAQQRVPSSGGGLRARASAALPWLTQHDRTWRDLPGRHRQLVGVRSRWRAIRTACPWLRPGGDAGDLGPNLKGLAPSGSILDGWNLVAAEQEEVVDPVVGREEALRLAG